MVPGGSTELIWHFLGYLRTFDSEGRTHVAYEDPAHLLRQADFDGDGGHARGAPASPVEDDVGGGAAHLAALPAPAGHATGVLHAAAHPLQAIPSKAAAIVLPHQPPRLPLEGADFIARHNYPFDPDPSPMGKLAIVGQLNELVDSDQFGTSLTPSQVTGLDVLAATYSLIDLARDAGPVDLRDAPTTTAGTLDWIAARDEALAAGDRPAGTAQPGLYVNGEVVTESPVGEAPEHSLREPAGGGPSGVTGQVADVGANTAVNAAVLVDLGGFAAKTVVYGDLFRTDAIIQVNVLGDSDQVQVAGGTAPATVSTGGNETNNVAEVKWTDPGEVSFHRSDLPWRVDVIEGDYLRITAVTQHNWIIDGDHVVQTGGSQVYAQVITGSNQAINVTEFFERAAGYDLIVVEGDLHSSNIIRQTNIVLDHDNVAMTSDPGGAGWQTISTGGNWLLNKALIEHVGSADAPTHTPGDWAYSGAASATLDVLYIKGDFWDINLVSQVNVIVDTDVVVQSAPPGSQGAATQAATAAILTADVLDGGQDEAADQPAHVSASGQLPSDLHPGDVVQDVQTGGNVAENHAGILDVSSFSAPDVGGDVYDDAVLIQTNIIAGDQDHIVYGDTASLANELVAFITADGDGATPHTTAGFLTSQLLAPAGDHPQAAPLAPAAHADHVLGGVMT